MEQSGLHSTGKNSKVFQCYKENVTKKRTQHNTTKQTSNPNYFRGHAFVFERYFKTQDLLPGLSQHPGGSPCLLPHGLKGTQQQGDFSTNKVILDTINTIREIMED